MACLLLLSLLTILALGMFNLSAIELRRALHVNHAAIARANARLALVQAIGQLQKSLGPDQRISAPASILPGNPAQPHWTGVWRSTRADGSSYFTRDDLSGGLHDSRWPANSTPAEQAIAWLVSGAADPNAGPVVDSVPMAHDGNSQVSVSKVAVKRQDGSMSGHTAWWTGDLGVRANIGTRDPQDDVHVGRGSPGGDPWFRVMASQEAETTLITGGVRFRVDEVARLASSETVPLTAAGVAWSRQHAFDCTVDSQGVLADVAHGGLKRDLTAYFAGDGDIPSWKNLEGLKDGDSLVGEECDEDSFRHATAGPRFGLLRNWAGMGVAFSGKNVASRLPDVGSDANGESEAYALANEAPVKLAGNLQAGLQPILVEATDFTQMSTFAIAGHNPPLFQLRFHHYPRVVLWNPYNVELEFERSMIMIQGNGRQEMWTENQYLNSRGQPVFTVLGQWLSFEGGRSTVFNLSGFGTFNTEGYNDPYIGAYYFAIPKTRFAPGECLVFSPARQAEYDCLSPYRPGPYDLNNNELSCEVAPDPSRSYYISGTDINGGIPYRPVKFWYAPTPYWSLAGRYGVENQGDDTRAVLKHVESGSTVRFDEFDAFPQISVLSASLQYGAGREPRIAWSSLQKMPIEQLDQNDPQPTIIPNVRTREGIRLRWFHEQLSNEINSGALTGTAHFEDSLFGNWNPRAAYAVRSPWENIAGSLPKSGSAGGPWFFGAYTRDLYDQAVSWDEQTPVRSGGRYHGNPFGPPQEGVGRYVLFDVPRSETGVISLGQLQHAKISDLIWQPSYAIGNSLADPRLGSGGNKGLDRTAALAVDKPSSRLGGFHQNQLGWSGDTQRSASKDVWADTARAILGDTPVRDNLVYDLSFEANQTLWDRYFLSTGSTARKRGFLGNPELNPLPNARMRLAPGARGTASADDLTDFHRAASRLVVDGAFNVNSTRVEAWKALLGSTRLSGYGSGSNVPFPRVLDAPGGAWHNGDSGDADEVWDGYRELTPDEVDKLAHAIVDEVKLRGPFISLADFVNRRLAEDETGRMGALQAAIRKAGLNSTLVADYPLDNSTSLPDYGHPDHIPDSTQMEQTLKPASTAWGAPGWLTQADILQVLGPVLTARSDTFVIRAYGDATDASGNVTAGAWCEAVVQRTPEPLDPDESGLNPRLAGSNLDFGRRFIMKSFRWLTPGEI